MQLKPILHFATSQSPIRGWLVAFLVCSVSLGLTAPDVPKDDVPNAPLMRDLPRVYSMRVHVNNKKQTLGWPLLPRTNWCDTDTDSLSVQDANGQQIAASIQNMPPLDIEWRILPEATTYSVSFTAQAYSSILNEEKAITIPWPEEWNDEEELFLQPSKFIESNDSIFQKAVEQNGDPKSVPIHIAAKVLIRYCIENIQSTGRYSHSENNVTTGIDVQGARYTVKEEKGSAADMVCVCVATLRAAGIPARPIVGITNADTVGTKRIDPQYIVWGEYRLPGAGWVPFFPERMRGTVTGLSREEQWQGLGTLQWLNRRVPIAFNFRCFDADQNASEQNLQMNFTSSPE